MPDPPQNPKVNLAGSGTIPHVQRPDGEFVPVTGSDDGSINVTVSAASGTATLAEQQAQTVQLVSIAADASTIAAAVDVPISSVVTAINALGSGATLNTLAGYLATDQTTQADILAKLISIDATLTAKLDVPLSDLKTELQALNTTSASILGAVDGLEGSSTAIETNTGSAASSLANIAPGIPDALGQAVAGASMPVVLPVAQSSGELAQQATLATRASEATVASIDAGIPAALGQTTSAASMPVVLSSTQSPGQVAQDASVDGLEGLVSTTNTTLVDGSQKAIVRGGAKGATVAADVTSTAEGADHQALDTQVYHGNAAIDPREIRVSGAPVTVENPARVLSTATRLDPSYVRLTSRDGFGRPLTVELDPVVQATFTAGMKITEWTSYTSGTGTVTTTAESDGLGYARTGANASSIAERLSVSSFTYRAGQSFEVEFTTVFSAPAVGGMQAVGAGTNDAVAVGYNGTSFGFLIRTGGRNEQRVLTITTASTTAENVTVTLDGVATLVAVTNSGNTVTTAREIAAGNYSAAGVGWDATQTGSTVVFVARRPGAKSGSYALTATTAVGSFAQRLAGVAPTDNWIAKTAWSGDRLDGATGANNLTGANIDLTKGQIWKIVVAHLGFGPITLHWQDPTTEEWTLCHKQTYANVTATPNLFNPTLRLWIYAAGAANITSASRSMLLACHGPIKLTGRVIAIPAASKSTVGTSPIPVVTLRTSRYDNGSENRSPYKPLVIMFTAQTTGEVTIHAYVNATLTGANFQAHADDAVLAYDTTATAATGGLLVGSFNTSRNGSGIPIDVSGYGLALQPGATVTFMASQNSGANGTVIISINGYLDCGCGSEN